MCSGWGVLSFLEFFSVFFSILRLFVRHCSSQFFGVFSRNLLVFFVESLEAVCCRRTLLPVVPVCWLVSSVVSSFLSMPTTRPTFNSLSADLFSTPSTSAPPSSGDSGGVSSVASGTSNSLSNEIAVAVAQAFQQSLPSFVAAFRAENLAAPVSSTALPPVSSVLSSVVSSVVPGSAMVAASSLSSVAGTLRLPSFVSSRHFLHPRLLLGPPGSFDLSSDYGVACYQLFFARRKFGSVRRQGVCGWPGSRSNPGKTGEKNYQWRVCGIGRLIVHQSPCSRLRAPVIFGWQASGFQKTSAG